MPDEAYDFLIKESKFYNKQNVLAYKNKFIWDKFKKECWCWGTKSDKLSIIGLQSEINEENAKEIVPTPSTANYDYYVSGNTITSKSCFTAKESFNSLMTSIECYAVNLSGTEPENKSNWDLDQQNTGNWLILKKNS